MPPATDFADPDAAATAPVDPEPGSVRGRSGLVHLIATGTIAKLIDGGASTVAKVLRILGVPAFPPAVPIVRVLADRRGTREGPSGQSDGQRDGKRGGERGEPNLRADPRSERAVTSSPLLTGSSDGKPPMKRGHRRAWRSIGVLLVPFFLPLGCTLAAHYSGDGAGGASRYATAGLAPSADSDEAVIQVYAARAARWRGAIGVHTWVATKRTDERAYTRLEVIGYRVYWGGGAVRVRQATPDGNWFGNPPTLLREIRGDHSVDALVERLHAAARDYPYDDTYHVWPGPNSNTFVAHLARQVPELRLELPANAVGKDYLPGGRLAALTPSGTGVQLSLGGYAGVMAGLEEGVELNLLGLTAGIDVFPPALKLPGVGRIGFPDLRRREIRDASMPELPENDPVEPGPLATGSLTGTGTEAVTVDP